MTTGGWLLRDAVAADAEQLADIVIAASEERRPFPSAEQRATWREGFVAWTRRAANDGGLSVVVDDAGRPIGRLRVRRECDRIELAGVQLLPAVQGRGIGTAIVRTLQREAAEQGVPLDLGVEHDNPRARALYERLGFVPVDRTEEEDRLRWMPPEA